MYVSEEAGFTALLYEVFYPEVSDNSEMKNVLMKELSDCSDYEMKIILSVVKSLRYTLKHTIEGNIDSI